MQPRAILPPSEVGRVSVHPGGKIAVALADQTIQMLVTTRLSLVGYEVSGARSGDECLQLLFRLKPVAAILDADLTGLDGMKLLQIMKQHRDLRSIAVLMMSKQPHLPQIRQALTLGAADYMGIPFEDDVFLTHVSRMVARAKAPAVVSHLEPSDVDPPSGGTPYHL